ncbi:hypothetical protein ACFXKY_07810 [Streptomyces canus]|uniref:hypothetical protein n=1 Tax=Streptomyces canus TaxID=58343 RepID=UPI0036C5D9CD
MAEQSVGPRCGNNPNARLTPGDRKVLDDFRARLALEAAAKPHIEAAEWVEGDPLMEVIAVTLWRHCARDDKDMPQLVCDDPRTIAAFAAAVARAETEGLREKHKASIRHADKVNGELMAEVQRYAEGTEHPVLWSVYNAMHLRAANAESALARVRAVLETEAVVGRSALEYRGLIASALMAAEPKQDGAQR